MEEALGKVDLSYRAAQVAFWHIFVNAKTVVEPLAFALQEHLHARYVWHMSGTAVSTETPADFHLDNWAPAKLVFFSPRVGGDAVLSPLRVMGILIFIPLPPLWHLYLHVKTAW